MIACFGISCLDQFGHVDAYPVVDSKVRTTQFSVNCGGNGLNCIRAISRYNRANRVVSKLELVLVSGVGKDGWGDYIVTKLQEDGGINTDFIFRSSTNIPTSLSYILICGPTRTVIHTPATDLACPSTPSEWSPSSSSTSSSLSYEQAYADLLCKLQAASILFFDGRHTDAAIYCLSHLATMKAVKRTTAPVVVVELESHRPKLDELASYADYITSSSSYFSSSHTSLIPSICEYMTSTNKSVRFVVSTLGKRGSVLILRRGSAGRTSSSTVATLDALIERATDFVSKSFTHMPVKCAAMLDYSDEFSLFYCSAIATADSEITNTTGAGDAFNAGLLLALQTSNDDGRDHFEALLLATMVANAKIKGVI